MLRKTIGGLVLAAVPLLAITQAQPASATCTIGGCPNGYASTCYNLKKYKWCSTNDGYSKVYVTNKGSYEGAFDWARNEISSPHNGIGNSLKLAQKDSGGNIKVYDYTGTAFWWGLASNYVTVSGSNKCLSTVKVQINKNYMSSSIRKKYTLLHEFGHAVGLNHSCVCPRTMNPCGTCGDDGSGSTPYLKKCDAKGVKGNTIAAPSTSCAARRAARRPRTARRPATAVAVASLALQARTSATA